MIVDCKVFDVGVQKALNIKTFSCDWFGKSIIGKKKTSTTKNKSPPLQKRMKKEPPQVWWSFKPFGIWWECFLILLFILTKQLYYSNFVWNLSNYLGIKSVYNLIHVMHAYTLHDEYTMHKYVCYI